MDALDYWIMGVMVLVTYFIPTIVAISRKHRNKTGIIILNIFAGWTIIGWIGALVWSTVDSKRK